jgi:hypothetical protein
MKSQPQRLCMTEPGDLLPGESHELLLRLRVSGNVRGIGEYEIRSTAAWCSQELNAFLRAYFKFGPQARWSSALCPGPTSRDQWSSFNEMCRP